MLKIMKRIMPVGIAITMMLGMRGPYIAAYADDEYDSQYDDDDGYDDEYDDNNYDEPDEDDYHFKVDMHPYYDEHDKVLCDKDKLHYYGEYLSSGFAGISDIVYYGLCNDGVHEFVQLMSKYGGSTTMYDVFQFSDDLERNSDAWYDGENYFAWIEGVDLHSMASQFDSSIMENRKNQIIALIGNRPAIIMKSGSDWGGGREFNYMSVQCYNLAGFEKYSVNPLVVPLKTTVHSDGFPKHDYPGGPVQSGPLVDESKGIFAARAAGTYAYKYNDTTTYYCYLGFYADNGQPFIKRERKDNGVAIGSIIMTIGNGVSFANTYNSYVGVYRTPTDHTGPVQFYMLRDDSGIGDYVEISNQEIVNHKFQVTKDGVDYNSWFPEKVYEKISNEYPAENSSSS